MALSRITEAVASFTDLTIGDDLTLTDDFLMASDASIIKFGADADVTLTHVHNTGLLLNSTSVIQFNDSSQNIGAPNATTLDINATDEIELNATLVDVNANLDVSGTYTGAGLMTTGGNIVIPDAGNIGSASDTDAIAISSGGVVTFSQNPVFPDGGIAIADLDIDGASDIGAALADADLIIVDDGAGGTNRKATLSRLKTYIGASTAADDLTAGDAAVNLNTTSGNITIDAQGNDTDIIFKGTDGSSDTTFLTIDGSAAGKATFNNEIVSGAVITSGAGLVIADAGNIGSASDTDAIAISSGGVVTMNQIPVFSAGINVSGGSIAGTLSTAAQANVTSLGTLTTLTVDNVIINGTTIGHTDDTDLITVADGIATVAGEISVTTLDIGGTNVTATAAELNLLDGGTSVGSSITLADADGFVVNDGGTMKTIPASDIKTYNPGGTAWQSVVTSNTTMVAGRGYFVNTAGGAITMTLPSSASQGDTIQIIDYAGTADTNNITIGRNSHKIQGDSADLTVSTERAAFTLVYVNATQGWLLDSK